VAQTHSHIANVARV